MAKGSVFVVKGGDSVAGLQVKLSMCFEAALGCKYCSLSFCSGHSGDDGTDMGGMRVNFSFRFESCKPGSWLCTSSDASFQRFRLLTWVDDTSRALNQIRHVAQPPGRAPGRLASWDAPG